MKEETVETRTERNRQRWTKWLISYQQRLSKEMETNETELNRTRVELMNSNNPKIILRNHLAQRYVRYLSSSSTSDILYSIWNDYITYPLSLCLYLYMDIYIFIYSAIEQAEKGDFREVNALYKLLQHPFAENPQTIPGNPPLCCYLLSINLPIPSYLISLSIFLYYFVYPFADVHSLPLSLSISSCIYTHSSLAISSSIHYPYYYYRMFCILFCCSRGL